MTVWLRTLLLSIFFHLMLFWLLSRAIVTPELTQQTPALKTYLVMEPPSQLPEPALPSPPKEAAVAPTPQGPTPKELLPKAADDAVIGAEQPAEPTTSSPPVQQQAPVSASVVAGPEPITTSAANPAGKVLNISPQQILDNLRTQQLDSFLAEKTAPAGKAQPARLRVPTEHAQTITDKRVVVSKNALWTEYQDGDSCYKEMNADPNVPGSRPWIAPVNCNNSTIKASYDEIMKKWLPAAKGTR
ncbi:hypothetical protein ACFOEE_01200 [Pseudoalteromonas fenneropenaei]|uniref:DUF4124 domain-containing protein n=1 Tax=Pseudoalteromonas fenneropenaei TaxID=1737459 RepID=A0ABV7CEY2_9GAMM